MTCNICGYVFCLSLWFYSDVDMRRKYLKKIATIPLEKIESAPVGEKDFHINRIRVYKSMAIVA